MTAYHPDGLKQLSYVIMVMIRSDNIYFQCVNIRQVSREMLTTLGFASVFNINVGA